MPVYRCDWCGRFYSDPSPEGSACQDHITEHNERLRKGIERHNAKIEKVVHPTLITARVCGGKQGLICSVTKQPHDMSAFLRFTDGGSVACKDCGATAMDIDVLRLP